MPLLAPPRRPARRRVARPRGPARFVLCLLVAVVVGAIPAVASAQAPDPSLPACSNSFDDDGDGHMDFPADPGCDNAADNDETNIALPVTPPTLPIVDPLLNALPLPPLTGPAQGARPDGGQHANQGNGDFVGLVAEDAFFNGDETYRRQANEQQAALGVTLVRNTLHWSHVERSKGNYDFSIYDNYVAALARNRIRLLPILFDPPAFRSSAPRRRARKGMYPPKSNKAFAQFAAAVVRRYGQNGTFWAERPEVPKMAIRSWQIWNEPHIQSFWPTKRDPRKYVALLRESAKRIKQVDPGAEIVAAGISDSPRGVPFKDYFKGMYKAGGKPVFDTLAFHPYARREAEVLKKLRQARSVMSKYRDRAAKLWITEMGWASGGPRSIYTVGNKGHASRLTRLFRLLGRERVKLNLRGFVYYNWRDGRPYPGRPDFWGFHTGLIENDGKRKPAHSAFEQGVKRFRGF